MQFVFGSRGRLRRRPPGRRLHGQQPERRRRLWLRLLVPGPRGRGRAGRDRLSPGQSDHSLRADQAHRRANAVSRRLVQARARRPDDALGPQRQRQDDAAADARGRGRPRRRDDLARQGRPRRAPRPAPAARAMSTLREYVHRRARLDRSRSSPSSRELEARMADGDAAEATLDAYADAQARLEHAGGYRWRDGGDADASRARLRRRRARPAAVALLRRRADPGLAGPRARLEARSAAARRAHQPPRHRVARVARALPGRARRGGHPRRPRPLVPGIGRDLGARARGRPGALLRRALARVAGRAGRARARRRPRRRPPPGRDRAHGAVRRALPLQGDQGAPGAVEAEGDRAAAGAARPRPTRATSATLVVLVRRRRALRAGRARARATRRSRSATGP